MNRPVTIERTSKPIKAWLLLSELGILFAIVAFVGALVGNNPDHLAMAMVLGGVCVASRIIAGAARWWVNG